MWDWLCDNWPQAVTWILIPVSSLVVGHHLSLRSSKRGEQRARIKSALERIEAIEHKAVSYWTDGRQPEEPAACFRSHEITRDIDRLEAELDHISVKCKRSFDYVDALVSLRQSITSDPWQSLNRQPIPADDSRIIDIRENADILEKLVKRATKPR